MKSQNLKTNVHDVPTGILQSDFAEERGKNGPSLAEIRHRAFQIRLERGRHGYDLDEYLDEWQQAERVLREKYNRSNDQVAKRNEMGVRKERR